MLTFERARALGAILERISVIWKPRRVGKAKRAHQSRRRGGHGARERAFAHPTSDSSRPERVLSPVNLCCQGSSVAVWKVETPRPRFPVRARNYLFRQKEFPVFGRTGNRRQAIELTWREALKAIQRGRNPAKFGGIPVNFPVLRECEDTKLVLRHGVGIPHGMHRGDWLMEYSMIGR